LASSCFDADESTLTKYLRQTEEKANAPAKSLFARNPKRCAMTSKTEKEAFVWIWLSGETEPVVTGRLEADNGNGSVQLR